MENLIYFCFGRYSVKPQDPPRPVPKSFTIRCSVSHCTRIFHVFIWSTFLQLQGAARVPLRKFSRFLWTESDPYAALGWGPGALEPLCPPRGRRRGGCPRCSLPASSHLYPRDGGKLSLPQPRGNAEARSQKRLRGCMHVPLGVTDRQLETALSTTVLAPFISCCCC